jgi:hypothetical protein
MCTEGRTLILFFSNRIIEAARLNPIAWLWLEQYCRQLHTISGFEVKRMISILLGIAMVGCIDPIRLITDEGAGSLVVDGMITDQPGPHVIKLSRSINFDNSRVLRVYPIPEQKAIVTIRDDQGESEIGLEVQPGTYHFNTIQGAVGRTYELSIQTATGNTYASQPETMTAVPPIEGVDFELKFYDHLFINAAGNPRILPIDAFFIYATVKDPSEKGNYYRWQADGIFEFFSLNDNPSIKQCWAPIPRLESKIEIADDTHINGKQFRQLVCIIPYDRPTQFLVKIRQQSLTEAAHNFWKESLGQQITTGSLFDPPASSIVGNIFNVTNQDETVIGFFGASSIYRTSLLLERFKDAAFVPPGRPIPPRPGDCRTQELGATNVKPEGFK